MTGSASPVALLRRAGSYIRNRAARWSPDRQRTRTFRGREPVARFWIRTFNWSRTRRSSGAAFLGPHRVSIFLCAPSRWPFRPNGGGGSVSKPDVADRWKSPVRV